MGVDACKGSQKHAIKGWYLMAADALVAGTELANKEQPNPVSNDLLDEDMGPLKRAAPTAAGQRHAALNGSLAITDGIIQFDGEREMWASFQDANLRKRRWWKLLIGGAALLVGATTTSCGPDFVGNTKVFTIRVSQCAHSLCRFQPNNFG